MKSKQKTVRQSRTMSTKFRARKIHELPTGEVSYLFKWQPDNLRLPPNEIRTKPGDEIHQIRKALLKRGLRFETAEKANQEIKTALKLADCSEALHFESRLSGWLEDKNVFLFPGERRKIDGDYYSCAQSAGRDPRFLAKSTGSFDGWKEEMAQYVVSSPPLILAVAASISATLVKFVDLPERPVFLFHGNTRTGKTNLLRAAQGLFGAASNEALLTGHTTHAALQEFVNMSRDFAICIDEVNHFEHGSSGFKKFMDFMNAAGKSSGFRRSAAVQDELPDTYNRSATLGTTENSPSQLALDAGIRIDAGAQHRLMEIPIPTQSEGGIFYKSPKQSGRLIEGLNQAIIANQAVSMAPWIEYLESNTRQLSKRIGVQMKNFMDRKYRGDQSTDTVKKRFAFVYAAGRIFIDAGLAPWDEKLLLSSIWELFISCDRARRFPPVISKTASNLLEAKRIVAKDENDQPLFRQNVTKNEKTSATQSWVCVRTDAFKYLNLGETDFKMFRAFLKDHGYLKKHRDRNSIRYSRKHRFGKVSMDGFTVRECDLKQIARI